MRSWPIARTARSGSATADAWSGLGRWDAPRPAPPTDRDALDAQTALQLGIVTDVVDEPADVMPYARDIAARIAALPPLAVQGTKRALNAVSTLRADEVVELAFDLEETTLVSSDLLKAIAAFREGRTGTFTGS